MNPRTIWSAAVMLVLAGCAAAGPEEGPFRASSTVSAEARSYVVMVSFDGMRYDFIDRLATPNFDRLARRGARAAALIPSYPSKTFPNHYTLATGLYPARHGLVDNAFYDAGFDDTYTLGNSSKVRDGRWYGGEPIWVTAEKQGVRAASFFWVGSEAEIAGVRPTYSKLYDEDFPYAARVDTVLHWLSLPADGRPHLVLLYFDEPDHTAHASGPDHPAVDSTVVQLDALLGRLLDGLARLPVADRVNLVVVSDHGMAPAPADQVIRLDDYADLGGVRVLYNSTQALLYADGDAGRMEEVHRALRDRVPHASVYRRQETPERWRYRDNPRAGDLVVASEPGWILSSGRGRPWAGGGMHGWDPFHRPMQGVFLAAGPGIRANVRIPAFQNIHVYPLVAWLLGLEPAAGIDGRLDVVAEILAAPAPAW